MESIDRLYDSIAKDMRVTPVTELDSYRHRGYGGIFGHIDRHGDFIRTHDGNHRFAIARCLGLKLVPVHVGLVHPIAVRDGLIPFLRQQSLQLVNSGG